MLDEMLRSAFGEFVRISSAPDLRAAEQQAVQHEDSSALAFPAGQGLDLLEARGWADRASGVIEV